MVVLANILFMPQSISSALLTNKNTQKDEDGYSSDEFYDSDAFSSLLDRLDISTIDITNAQNQAALRRYLWNKKDIVKNNRKIFDNCDNEIYQRDLSDDNLSVFFIAEEIDQFYISDINKDKFITINQRINDAKTNKQILFGQIDGGDHIMSVGIIIENGKINKVICFNPVKKNEKNSMEELGKISNNTASVLNVFIEKMKINFPLSPAFQYKFINPILDGPRFNSCSIHSVETMQYLEKQSRKPNFDNFIKKLSDGTELDLGIDSRLAMLKYAIRNENKFKIPDTKTIYNATKNDDTIMDNIQKLEILDKQKYQMKLILEDVTREYSKKCVAISDIKARFKEIDNQINTLRQMITDVHSHRKFNTLDSITQLSSLHEQKRNIKLALPSLIEKELKGRDAVDIANKRLKEIDNQINALNKTLISMSENRKDMYFYRKFTTAKTAIPTSAYSAALEAKKNRTF